MSIKFCSKNDMVCGMQINNCLAILDKLDITTFEIKDLNQCLEYYNLLKYDEAFNFDDKYKESLKSVNSAVHKFVNTCDIILYLNDIDFNYHEDFWELFEKDKLYQKYDFESILAYANEHISLLLSHKDIVNAYSSQLVEYLSNQDDAGELLVKSDVLDNGVTLYFPDGLDKKSLIEKYVNSNKANLNYLNAIYISKNLKLDYLNDEIRVKAIENYRKIYEERKDSFHEFGYGFSISFKKDLEKPLIFEKLGSKFDIQLNLDDILNNLDCNEFLFIYYLLNVLDLLDKNGIISNLPDINTESVFLRALNTANKNEYSKGPSFELYENFNIGIIDGYDHILIENDLSLEKLIKWYLEKYVVDEFGVKGFSFGVSQSNSYIEKTRNLCAELDGLLKQYNYYCISGNIDRTIIEYSSASMGFDNIGSLIEDKYAEIIDDSLCGDSAILCSDQSLAGYIEGYGKNTLYDNLTSHNIQKAEIKEISIQYVDELIKENVVEEKNGYLKVSKLGKLLHQWFHKGTLLTNDAIKFIDESKLKQSTCLFSWPEINYLNYSLKDGPYSNCLGIRNKYMHGTNSLNEKVNRHDYYQVLLLTLYVVLKINDELVRVNEE